MSMKDKGSILEHLARVLAILKEESSHWEPPVVGRFAHGPNMPFRVLISTVLSLRTKDKTTGEASLRLFKLADTPHGMLSLPASTIEQTIFPVGFYRTKAKSILRICEILKKEHGGRVPDHLEELLKLPGVGRKTANLVVTVAYKKLGICVDTHVHRISNRWGIVRTKTPEETEQALRKILPKHFWIQFNNLLVAYGQNLCVPLSPFCSRCRIAPFCPRIGVRASR